MSTTVSPFTSTGNCQDRIVAVAGPDAPRPLWDPTELVTPVGVGFRVGVEPKPQSF